MNKGKGTYQGVSSAMKLSPFKIDLIKGAKVASFSNAALLLDQQTSLLHTISCPYQ